MTLSDLLDHILAEENTKAGEVFEALIAERISEIVEELRPYVAEEMMTGELSIDEDMQSLDKEISAKKASGKWKPYNKLSMRKNILADKARKEASKKKVAEETDLEEEEELSELSKKTLKSYTKKAQRDSDRHYDKGNKEEDKAMATDGNKYPEKQERHNQAAYAHQKKWYSRGKGLNAAHGKLQKMAKEEVDLDEADAKKVVADFKAGKTPSWRAGGGTKGFLKRKIADKLAAKNGK